MIKFTTIIIVSLIAIVIGWGLIGIGILRNAKTKTGEKFNIIFAIIGIVTVAMSFGLILGEKERQIEMMPKVFQAKEYTLETVIENKDTTYVITKIQKD